MYPIVDLVEHQTIAAVQKEDDLAKAIASQVNVIFLLTGSILNVKAMVDRVKEAGKVVFLHMEFIEGIAADRGGIAYVAQHVQPHGIISTRSQVIRTAKELKLLTIQRMFLIDRNAIGKGIKMAEQAAPDAIEVMPGIMPRIVREMTALTPLPIIAGGLFAYRHEIDEALEAGALAVSVGSAELW
ncbi:MAG: glycerol-3-phosphate responsive antiterminator [Paenibacillaceae bacterium]|nr:glycerol-3-phosphate responsive antiterminator [Paenibacillaceae bacterium]